MVNADPLIELVGFLHDKNPQVRAVAASVFPSPQLFYPSCSCQRVWEETAILGQD